jgi:hypothetical protein
MTMRSYLLAAAIAPAIATVASAVVPTAYTVQLQARANLLANPDGSFNVPHGSTFGSTTVSLNNLGEVASKMTTVGSSSSDQGIFYGPGNGTGGVVAQQNQDTVGFLSDVNIGDTGRIIVSQSNSGAGISDGFYYRDRGQPTGLTYLTGASGLSASGYRVLPDNTVASRTALNNVTGYRSYNPAGGAVQTYITQQAGAFSFLASAAPTNDGRIAGRVFNDLQPSTANDQIRLFNADGSSTLIATEGGSVPGVAGTITSFQNSISASNNGFVAFIASVGGKTSVIVSDGTTTRLVANADNPLVSAIDSFAPSVNSAGLVAFRGKEEDGDDAIFIGDGLGNLTRVIGEADTVSTDIGLAQLGQETASPPTFAGGIALNDSNQIAFTTGLYPVGNRAVEYGTGIFIANVAVPEPATLGALAGVAVLVLRRRQR